MMLQILLKENFIIKAGKKIAKFIKACECPNCGNICLDDGYTFDFQTNDNVIALNCFSNTEWYCEECIQRNFNKKL